MKRKHKLARLFNQNGFTLLELMVVLVILAMLASVVVPNVLSNRDVAMAQKAQADIALLEQAIEMYRMENYSYPSTNQGLQILLEKSKNGGESMIKRLPDDPWGRPYLYLQPGKHSSYDVYTLGLDGLLGGDGLAKDLGNWSDSSSTAE